MTNWQVILTIAGLLIAFISLCWSIFNTVVGKAIAVKITQNDLAHLTIDVDKLKESEKEYRADLKKELRKIFRRLGRIEKNQAVRDRLCDERHKEK